MAKKKVRLSNGEERTIFYGRDYSAAKGVKSYSPTGKDGKTMGLACESEEEAISQMEKWKDL